ncbi:HEAT repeat domain-containing protein [Desulfobacula sp.]|uniref:HEAT repeat domain-containing protein n=1 Tax=Desulfobacula sp. TaxID=2593537 RepID=UPI00261E83E3|nr:HEAT repeat domain-containing protein [Desulfobacula sp.]
MKKPVGIFLASLAGCELLAFSFVYHSNLDLYQTLTDLAQAGHRVVPTGSVRSSLAQVMPAVYGSLFVLFTAGILISLILTGLAMMRKKSDVKPSGTGFIYFLPFLTALLVSGLLLVTLTDRSIFLRTRDYLLLSNTPGTALNTFYYTYTPYASQAINPPVKRPVKSCWIDPEIPHQNRLASQLSRFGWFTTLKKNHTAFRIEPAQDHTLIFWRHQKKILSVSVDDFHQDPGQYLKQYSQQTDAALFVRFLCAAGLFTGLPLFFFLVLFWFFSRVCCRFISKKPAMWISGSMVAGVTLIILLYLAPGKVPNDTEGIQQWLLSPNTRTRIEALRAIYYQSRDIWQFPAYVNHPGSNRSRAEKYWLAKAFSRSASTKSIPHLKQLIQADTINVQSAATKALSTFECDRASATIFMDLMDTSPHWYVQQAAYTGLKGCP